MFLSSFSFGHFLLSKSFEQVNFLSVDLSLLKCHRFVPQLSNKTTEARLRSGKKHLFFDFLFLIYKSH